MKHSVSAFGILIKSLFQTITACLPAIQKILGKYLSKVERGFEMQFDREYEWEEIVGETI